MTISNYVQIVLLILALICIVWAWHVATPYGGDAGLGDAIAKLFGYGIGGLFLLIVVVWFCVQHIQLR